MARDTGILKILIFFIFLFFVLTFLVLLFSKVELSIETDKLSYSNGAQMKLKIKNKSYKNICFSSNYPYLLQKKQNDRWETYSYQTTDKKDIIEICLSPLQVKNFELSLEGLNSGIHRIEIGACVGCQLNQEFKKTHTFYSNQFTIK